MNGLKRVTVTFLWAALWFIGTSFAAMGYSLGRPYNPSFDIISFVVVAAGVVFIVGFRSWEKK